MADTHSLPEPLDPPIPGVGVKRFLTFEDVYDWATAEQQAWEPLTDEELVRQVSQPFSGEPKDFLGRFEKIVAQARDAIEEKGAAHDQLRNNIHTHMVAFVEGKAPVSQTGQGQLILRTWRDDPRLAAAMLAVMQDKMNPNQGLDLSVRAAVALRVHASGSGVTAEDEKRALEGMKAEFTRQFSQEHQRVEAAANKIEQTEQTLGDEYRTKIGEAGFTDQVQHLS